MTTRSRKLATKRRARTVTRAARTAVSGRFSMPRSAAETEVDARLAAAYDLERGYDRPRRDRSKEAHEMAETAPVVRWFGPAARPTS